MLATILTTLIAFPGVSAADAVDLYLPKRGSSSRPLLVYIHGGAWISGDKRDYAALGQRFAAMGIAFAAVNYRLSTIPGIMHPAHALDTAKAIAWLVKSERGFDPQKVFVSGHSAGGHIAATLATNRTLWQTAGVPTGWRPAGYIGFEGIYDIPTLAIRWPTYPQWFLTKAFGDAKSWAQASPARLKNADHRPWLVIHSQKDELVDTGQSIEFAKAMRNQGVVAVYVEVPFKSHFAVVTGLGIAGDPATEAVRRFIAKSQAESKRHTAR
jgi:acetyl esterase/lipase